MSSSDPRHAALARLIAEARNEKTPELRWDALETGLVERVRQTRTRTLAPRSPALPWALAFAGAAALGTGLLVFSRWHSPAPVAPATAALAPAPAPDPHRVNGDGLAVGAVVASDAEDVVVEHAGHVTWTLSSNSVAHVESVGNVVALALDSGSISAHVVKSPQPESFVIRVARTRVAVHGTKFRVDRVGDRVHVEVEEGVVAVGPVGGKSFELPAPGSATLSLDGVRSDVPRAAVRAAPKPAEEPKETATTEPSADEPGPSDVDRVADGIVESVRNCFAENTVSRGDLKVSVQTRMSLHVLANGHVEQASFSPPLAPAVTRCVSAALAPVTFSAGPSAFVVERTLGLDR